MGARKFAGGQDVVLSAGAPGVELQFNASTGYLKGVRMGERRMRLDLDFVAYLRE